MMSFGARCSGGRSSRLPGSLVEAVSTSDSFFFFFFQAEDGIRDLTVTGVQTCALPILGKLGFGALLDRFDQRRVAAVCFCLQSAGVLLLWTTRSMPLLACYVVLYGYAMGGNATLFASLNAAAFGRLHYGAIAGRMSPFLVLAQAIGVPATGYLRDHTGSFGPVLATVTVASLLAAAIVLRVRLPGRLQPAAASRTNPR